MVDRKLQRIRHFHGKDYVVLSTGELVEPEPLGNVMINSINVKTEDLETRAYSVVRHYAKSRKLWDQVDAYTLATIVYTDGAIFFAAQLYKIPEK